MKIRKYKLQNLILSFQGLLEENHEMMYRGTPYIYDKVKSYFRWNEGSFAEFFTYFNAFARNKWLKYTKVENAYLQLRCKGRFKIRLFGHYRVGSAIGKEMYDEIAYDLPEMTDIQIPIPKDSNAEVIGFQFDVLHPTAEEKEKLIKLYDLNVMSNAVNEPADNKSQENTAKDYEAADKEDEQDAADVKASSAELMPSDTALKTSDDASAQSDAASDSAIADREGKKPSYYYKKAESGRYESLEDDPAIRKLIDDRYCLCIESGGWYTDVDVDGLNDVNISIATTTFNNEKYIKRNMDLLEREIFYSGEAVRDHIKMIVIDNGRTLDPDEFGSEYITVIPNENVGGAGGFTRGMLESIDREDFKATHVLLMDDDVTMMPESFVRLYSLLSLVKPKYKEHFISGAMLYYEHMNIQHEDVGFVHDDGSFGPNKKIMDMQVWSNVFENEEDIKFHENSYAGWWYCCIPVSKIKLEHLPVPLFIRGDDVEFSLSCKAEFITLGGICIWHKGFANKFNANLELYMVHRNSLIIQAMDGVRSDVDFIARIDKYFKSHICRYAYGNCELLLDAVEEFCKGPDFMNTPEGERIMKSHAAKNEKMEPAYYIYTDPIDFDSVYDRTCGYDLFEEEYTDKKNGKRFKRKMKPRDVSLAFRLTNKEFKLYEKTYNGQTMSDWRFARHMNRETAVIAYDWFDAPEKQYMAKEILAVNPADQTAILRKRDRKKFKALMKRRRRVLRYYKINRKKIEAQYREAGKKLQSEGFWRNYLGMKK